MTVVFSRTAPFTGAPYEYLRADDALPTYKEIPEESDPLCRVKLSRQGRGGPTTAVASLRERSQPAVALRAQFKRRGWPLHARSPRRDAPKRSERATSPERHGAKHDEGWDNHAEQGTASFACSRAGDRPGRPASTTGRDGAVTSRRSAAGTARFSCA